MVKYHDYNFKQQRKDNNEYRTIKHIEWYKETHIIDSPISMSLPVKNAKRKF